MKLLINGLAYFPEVLVAHQKLGLSQVVPDLKEGRQIHGRFCGKIFLDEVHQAPKLKG